MPATLERNPETAAFEEGAAPEGKKPAAKRPKIRGRLPEKRTINLATVNVKRINWLLAIPLLLLTLAAVAAFGKFAVLDRFNAVAVAQSEVEALQVQLDRGYAAIEDFGEINDVYAHYTYSGMTEEELGRADRIAVMDLIERVVLATNTPLEGWSLSGNQLVLDISGNTLQEINLVVQRLLAEDMVDYCTVTTAATADTSSYGESAPEEESVTANVIVQLKSAQREDNA